MTRSEFDTNATGVAWEVDLVHDDFVGWTFTIGFTPGGVPAGFRMTPSVLMPSELYKGSDALGALEHLKRWNMSPGAPALTARMLREVPLGRLQEAASKSYAARANHTRETAERWERAGWASDNLRQMVADLAVRPGRQGRPDREYAFLSAAYVDGLARGERLAEIAAALHVGPSTLRNQLTAARRRGLLTSASAGRSGGSLTARALELLEQDD